MLQTDSWSWVCVYTPSLLFQVWLTLAPWLLNLPCDSVYLVCVGSALLAYYDHWINPLLIFIHSHFDLPWYRLLLLHMIPLTHAPTHQLPALLDFESITLGTRFINFPVTSNNLYIPVSLIFLTRLGCSRVREGVVTWKPKEKSNFSRIEAWAISHLGHFLSYFSNPTLHLHCSLTTCLNLAKFWKLNKKQHIFMLCYQNNECVQNDLLSQWQTSFGGN